MSYNAPPETAIGGRKGEGSMPTGIKHGVGPAMNSAAGRRVPRRASTSSFAASPNVDMRATSPLLQQFSLPQNDSALCAAARQPLSEAR